MTTLKQLADGVIKAGGKWSGPGISPIQYETGAALGKNFNFSFVAPSDGYVMSRGQATTYYSIGASSQRFQSAGGDGYIGGTLRVRKGEKIIVEGADRTSGSSERPTETWFVPLLGLQ